MKQILFFFLCTVCLFVAQAQAAVPPVAGEKFQPPQSPFFYSSDKDSEVWGIRNPKPQKQGPGWNIPDPVMPVLPMPIIIMPDRPAGKPAPVLPILR